MRDNTGSSFLHMWWHPYCQVTNGQFTNINNAGDLSVIAIEGINYINFMVSYELCRTIVAIVVTVIMIVKMVIILLMAVTTYMFNGNDYCRYGQGK